jgi:site-specific DNA recombinase
MKAIGYARVSTDEQAAEGVSLDAQVRKIRDYCRIYDIELVDVVVDGGVSGKSLDRPGVQDVLGMMDRKEVDGVVVAKLDRLTRSVRDLNVLVEKYFVADAGMHLVSIHENINTQTAMGRFMINVVGSIAQLERETIVERTTEALSHKKRIGEVVGSTPYGWDVGGDGKTLVENDREQRVLDYIRHCRVEGMSFQEVADALNEQRVPKKYTGKVTKRGVVGGVWSKKDVFMVLSRESDRRAG